MTERRARRGRPSLAWVEADQLTTLRLGTAVRVERRGRHTARITGRITGHGESSIELDTTTMGEISMALTTVRRALVVPALYEPGDPVLLRHVPASVWRGGVVRTSGTDVLVEQLDGQFVWHPEADLEPAEARDPVAPPSPRGPVPSGAGR